MAKVDGRTKAALWLLISPTALIVISILGFALMNWVYSGETGGIVAANIFLWLVGVVGVVAWLPGLVIGIVLLATQAKK
jgi:hypothetical protein